jgi:hypothetical protein
MYNYEARYSGFLISISDGYITDFVVSGNKKINSGQNSGIGSRTALPRSDIG